MPTIKVTCFPPLPAMNVCMLHGPLWFCRHACLHVSLFLLLIHASSPDNFWRWSKRTVQYIKMTKMSKKKSWLKAKPVKAWLNIFFLDQFSLISPFPVNYVFFYILCHSLIYPGYFFFFKLKAFTVKFLLSKKKGGPGDNRYDVQICLFHECSFSPPVALLGS